MKLADNKKAFFNYQIIDTYNLGMVLTGSEVKSIRLGRVKLDGSKVLIRGDEAYLLGVNINPYQPNNPSALIVKDRPIKLLISKKELSELVGKVSRQGLTLVPISMYNKGRYLKLEVALAKGKKKFDKREVIKKRDTERDLRRSLKD